MLYHSSQYLFKWARGTILQLVLEHAVHTFFVINLSKKKSRGIGPSRGKRSFFYSKASGAVLRST